MTLGLDPLTAGIATTILPNLIDAFFRPPAQAPAAPAGLSSAQLANILAQQEAARRSSDRTRNAWLIGIGLVAVGVVAVVMVRRP